MRSIGITSPGSSTTHRMLGSRRSSAQIVQRGPSARLKQISHSPMRSLTSRMAAASANASSRVGAQDVERQPLRRALPDARQLGQLGDEALQWRG